MLDLNVPRFSYDITKWFQDNLKYVETIFVMDSIDRKKLVAILAKQCEYKVVVHRYLTSLIQKNKWVIKLNDGTIINGGDFKEWRDNPNIKEVSVNVLGTNYSNALDNNIPPKTFDFAVRVACEHDSNGVVDSYYKITSIYDKTKLIRCIYCNGESEVKIEYI